MLSQFNRHLWADKYDRNSLIIASEGSDSRQRKIGRKTQPNAINEQSSKSFPSRAFGMNAKPKQIPKTAKTKATTTK